MSAPHQLTYKMPVDGKWRIWTDAMLAEWSKGPVAESADALMDAYERYCKNRISCFLPHGVPWHGDWLLLGDGAVRLPPSEYPKEWKNDGLAFLNDETADCMMVTAPGQAGKSMLGAAKGVLLLIPTDPEWVIFQSHGVIRRPWTGPKILCASSYSWDNVATLWLRYQELLPREELGPYAPNYGKYPGERGKPEPLNFGDGKQKIVKLACGSKIKFLCDTQAQDHWEGFESDYGHFDEQREKQKFIGWKRSTQSRGDHTPCWFTLTGHCLPGRPDTGASGWVKRELWDGVNTQGMTVARYHISPDSVPAAIWTDKKRKQLWNQYCDPNVQRSDHDKRVAVARGWGGWEQSGGLVINSWDRLEHTVEPFEIPAGWTRYRVCDHGENPCAALWIAVSPEMSASGLPFAYAYAEYYEPGDIFRHAARIVELSGHRREEIGDAFRDQHGTTLKCYRELDEGVPFMQSVMDARSFAASTSFHGLTVGGLYSRLGCYFRAGSGLHRERHLVPMLLPWFAVPKGGGKPALRVFNNLKNTIWEIEGWTRDQETNKISGKDDHLCSCLLYWAACDPTYYGQRRDADGSDDSWRERQARRGKKRKGWSAY